MRVVNSQVVIIVTVILSFVLVVVGYVFLPSESESRFNDSEMSIEGKIVKTSSPETMNKPIVIQNDYVDETGTKKNYSNQNMDNEKLKAQSYPNPINNTDYSFFQSVEEGIVGDNDLKDNPNLIIEKNAYYNLVETQYDGLSYDPSSSMSDAVSSRPFNAKLLRDSSLERMDNYNDQSSGYQPQSSFKENK